MEYVLTKTIIMCQTSIGSVLYVIRYQTGMKDWGPKARASNKTGLDQSEKRKLNQNKRAEKRRKRDDSQVISHPFM